MFVDRLLQVSILQVSIQLKLLITVSIAQFLIIFTVRLVQQVFLIIFVCLLINYSNLETIKACGRNRGSSDTDKKFDSKTNKRRTSIASLIAAAQNAFDKTDLGSEPQQRC